MTSKINIFLSCLIILFSARISKAEVEGRKVTVNLYGHIVQYDYSPETFRAADKHEIALVYKTFSGAESTRSLVAQMDSVGRIFQMDDLAWLMQLNKLTDVVFKNEDTYFKTLFKYSVLSMKNRDVILGYSEDAVTLYGRTNFAIDNCLFIEKNRHKYYDLSFRQNAEPRTEQAFDPGMATQKKLPLVMNMITPPAFHATMKRKIFPFEYDEYLYFFNCNVNQSLVDYYRELPDISINTVYLNYGLASKAQQSLVKEMREAVAGMDKKRAVDFILKFTQQSITYRKDIVEKFSFPEETLLNDFADCEDKAMLFATLVKDVLGMRTVALYYKNAEHINVAVESWKENIKGNFTFNDHQYIICEPSGKGYAPGENSLNSNMASLIDW